MALTVFVCKDNLEGILTGVYDAWASGLGHENCKLQTEEYELELFCDYREVETDMDKVEKVIRTVKKRLGEEVYQDLCYVASSYEPDKADTVYHTIVAGFSLKNGRLTMDYLSNPYVARAFEIRRNVGNEINHMMEFLRFHELKSGVLFSKINPKNNISLFLAPHFTDRLPLENFMIYDEHYERAIMHERRGEWYVMDGQTINQTAIRDYCDDEEKYQALFRLFCKTIAIEPRRNLALQRNMLPLRFRSNMVEF